MTHAESWKGPRLGTQLTFAAAGFGMSCWAPLVPFAKARLGLQDGALGVLLLCLGAGSVVAMPLTGGLGTRLGGKPVILASAAGMICALPLLALFHTPLLMAATLLLFGACMGSLDVAMNLHAVEVENTAGMPLMSGFHALFSMGGFAGSAFMSIVLSRHVTPAQSALCGAGFVLCLVAAAAPRLLQVKGTASGPVFVLPKGMILILALLAAVSFLVEGAMLDWSAIFLVSNRILSATHGGVGYVFFSLAMTCGRLTGDRAVTRFGERTVLLTGSLTTITGLVLLLVSSYPITALLGFILIGLGAANIVPILLRCAGNQKQMPAGLAIAAVTTAGYAGLLTGPALIGFVAQQTDLRIAFAMLACLFGLILLFHRAITPDAATTG